MILKRWLLVVTGLALVALVGPRLLSSIRWSHLTGETMGTTYQVHFQHPWLLGTNSIQGEIESLLSSVNRELSTWDSTSWISEFNRAPAGIEYWVPGHAWEVLSRGFEIAEASGGAFDPTSFPLVRLWGFGPDRIERKSAPTPEMIQSVKPLCSYQNCTLNPVTHQITKLRDGVRIDCSAIAKGYVIDQISAILEKRKLSDYSIEIGGEVRVSGNDPRGALWKVRLKVPPAYPDPAPVLALHNQSVATSGGGQDHTTIGDTVYTHIIDPRTGYPLTGDYPYFSVSVIAPNCMLADALATACFILGPEKSKSLLAGFPNCELLFLEHSKMELQFVRLPSFYE